MNFKNRNQLFLSECFTQHYKKKEKGVVFLETDVVNTLNARTSKRACKTIGFPQNHTSRSKLKNLLGQEHSQVPRACKTMYSSFAFLPLKYD